MFPARSIAVTVTAFTPTFSVRSQEKLVPFKVAGTRLHITADSPERASDATPVTTRLGDVKVVRSAGEDTVRTGAVLSMLIVTLALTEVCAVSVAVPVTT